MTPLTSFLASSLLVAICSINCDFVICVAIVAPLIREAATIDGRSMKIRDFWRGRGWEADGEYRSRPVRWRRSRSVGPRARRRTADLDIACLERADSSGVALRVGRSAALKPGVDRASLCTEITDKLIAELEAGRVPWVQPWGTAAVKAPLAMPRNAATQRRYSGINVLILWGAVIERGFSGQSWLTFRQALGLGGHLRKGERGITVVYADRFTPEDERRRAAETGEEPGAIPFLKRFTVFNTDQCDDLPEHIAASIIPPPPGQIQPQAEALIVATGADFRVGGARAYYNTSCDFVPPPRAYFEPISRRGTAFHGLG